MLKKITFELETITPMFISGANQSKAELRAASIKGLLRFWWRALQAETDLDNLRRRESMIFGSSDEGIGGARFSIRITSDVSLQPITKNFPNKDNVHKIMVTSKKLNKTFPINILEYLAYGPFDPKTKKIRPYIDAKTKFNLIVSFLDDGFVDDVLKVMHVFALFGGIGSRSRNGFGSFSIHKHDSDYHSFELTYDLASLERIVDRKATLQPYSSFSQDTKIFRSNKDWNTWDESLADIGKIYRGIRVGDNKLNDAVFEQKHNFNKRQYLGAPLDPYQENFHSFLDRHAKPYFIKVAKEGDKYRAYILYLPSLYCEGLEKDRTGKLINHRAENERFSEVCKEFNEFLAQNMQTVI